MNMHFSQSLMIFLALWPVWWTLGVEQLVPPLWIGFEAIRYLVRIRGKLSISAPVVWAGLLAVWWLVPLMWLAPQYYGIFLKESATAWSQALFLLAISAQVRTRKGWEQVLRALCVFATLVTIGGLIYALGLWRGEITSVLGWVLPSSVESSTFFSSISDRSLGIVSLWGLLPWRLRSLFLHPNSLSMMALLLIPLLSWRAAVVTSWARVAHILVVLGLVVCLFGTESRISYVSFAAGLVAFALYALSRLGWRRFLLVSGFLLALTGILVTRFVDVDRVMESIRDLLAAWRPGSLIVRMKVYRATFEMLPQHLIAGWGVQIQLPDMPSSFSAGSHSSVLAMLFRHGVVGLALYIGLWASIWREVFRGLRQRALPKDARWFWVAAAIALLCFNVRELADTWWWDQTLTMTVWPVWGLVITAARVGLRGGAASAARAENPGSQSAGCTADL
jgi:hypothetical protein